MMPGGWLPAGPPGRGAEPSTRQCADPRSATYADLTRTNSIPFDAPELGKHKDAKIAALRPFVAKLSIKNRTRNLGHLK